MKKKDIIKAIVTIIIIIAAFLIIRPYTTKIFSNLELVKSIILSWGIFGPLLIILLQIVQGMTSFFPDSAVIIASGFLYGPILGILYNTIGELTSAIIFYVIARKYGRKILNTFIKDEHVENFQKILNKKGKWMIFFCRIIPVFPNNVINFTAGFAKLSFKEVIIINLVAIIPYTTVFALFGDKIGVILNNPLLLVITTIIIALWITSYLFIDNVKKWILKNGKK